MDRGTRRNRWDWQGRLAGVLLGGAGGVGIDLLGDEVGYQGVAMAIAAGVLLSATSWLRSLPRRAPLVRHTVRALLMLSLAGVAGVTFGPSSWTASLVLTVTVLIAAASLVAKNTETTHTLLLGSACVGGGMTAAGAGVTLLAGGDAAPGMALISFGAGYVGCGIVTLIRGYAYITSGRGHAVALVGICVGSFGAGVSLLTGGDIPLAAASLGFGVTLVPGAIAVRSRRLLNAAENRRLVGAARTGAGVATFSGAVILLTRGHIPVGAALACWGAAMIASGIAGMIFNEKWLRAAMYAGSGVVGVGLGIVLLPFAGQPMVALTVIGAGVALIGAHVTPLTQAGQAERLQTWLALLTRDPTQDENATSTDRDKQRFPEQAG